VTVLTVKHTHLSIIGDKAKKKLLLPTVEHSSAEHHVKATWRHHWPTTHLFSCSVPIVPVHLWRN